jgi:hypothetical protein
LKWFSVLLHWHISIEWYTERMYSHWPLKPVKSGGRGTSKKRNLPRLVASIFPALSAPAFPVPLTRSEIWIQFHLPYFPSHFQCFPIRVSEPVLLYIVDVLIHVLLFLKNLSWFVINKHKTRYFLQCFSRYFLSVDSVFRHMDVRNICSSL